MHYEKMADGRKLLVEGWVVIYGVERYLINKFVSCGKSLNGRAWSVTEAKSRCENCIENERKNRKVEQLEMFL